ncbi:helix-turn-helix domain-containing protein [Flavobacterium sp. IMCC34518]|uniref:helix-turn-helix domain-containing protein n=1 Tax=Flavobacterium sp. IMCC34518 TaxID=3003623 RepID=UPI0022AC88D3|nr:helix-turn-helix domain-containing protein [Flavobacterium sp. IMCC34518]
MQNIHNLVLTPISVEQFTEKIALRTIELLDQRNEKQSEKIYSVKELAEYAGVSELSIRNWILEGKIKADKIGRKILIKQSQFEKGLEEVKSLKYKR